jgi:isocitrate dehydrogenase
MAGKIELANGILQVPDHPIIVYIEGDGIGKDITPLVLQVIDAAVKKAYRGKRRIDWKEIHAGEKAFQLYGNYLPPETPELIKEYRVAIKGPLTTPIGGGFRSINVTLRQMLDLYACVRPVRYVQGAPSPMKNPEKLDITIFRENTEDVYAGVEFEAGSPEAERLISVLGEMKKKIHPGSAIGIKPMSRDRSERLIRRAIRHALDHGKKSVTLVHKGNIMKYTEGLFKKVGYELALREFRDQVITEDELSGVAGPDRRVVIKDRIADSMFQQMLLRPEEYDVLATPNLNGDYLSDAAAAQVGGLGMAPGANFSDSVALFEPTHGSAPKHAGQDKANPSSLLLSGVMMLEHLNWPEAAVLIKDALKQTIMLGKMTYDLARQFEGVKPLKTSDFAKEIINRLS